MANELQPNYYSLENLGVNRPLVYYKEPVNRIPTEGQPYFRGLRWMDSVIGLLDPKHRIWWSRSNDVPLKHEFLLDAAMLDLESVVGLFHVVPDRAHLDIVIHARQENEGMRIRRFCERRIDRGLIVQSSIYKL